MSLHNSTIIENQYGLFYLVDCLKHNAKRSSLFQIQIKSPAQAGFDLKGETAEQLSIRLEEMNGCFAELVSTRSS